MASFKVQFPSHVPPRPVKILTCLLKLSSSSADSRTPGSRFFQTITQCIRCISEFLALWREQNYTYLLIQFRQEKNIILPSVPPVRIQSQGSTLTTSMAGKYNFLKSPGRRNRVARLQTWIMDKCQKLPTGYILNLKYFTDSIPIKEFT